MKSFWYLLCQLCEVLEPDSTFLYACSVYRLLDIETMPWSTRTKVTNTTHTFAHKLMPLELSVHIQQQERIQAKGKSRMVYAT